jgi:O-antigen ligase
MKANDCRISPDGLQTAVFFCFCGFLLVALNIIIDPRAMDISLMPRLLAVQVFLLFVVAVVAVTHLAGRLDVGILRDPLILCFTGYTALTALSLFSAANTTAGFTEVFKVVSTMLVLALACLLLPWRRTWPTVVLKCAVVAGWLSVLAGLYDWITGPGWGWQSREQMLNVMGLMSNVNLYASFLLLVLPFCAVATIALNGPWRWVAGAAVMVLLPLMLALQTRAVYLGMVAALGAGLIAVYLARTRSGPRNFPTLLGAAGALVLAVVGFFSLTIAVPPVAERVRSIFADQSMTAAGGRPVIWLASLKMVRDHPLMGVGAGNFPVRLHEYFDTDDPEFSTVHPNWLQPHNDFLWVFAEKGIIAFILFLAVWVLALRLLANALRRGLPRSEAWLAVGSIAGLAGYAVVSFFDFPMERINHQVYFAFYLAIAVLLGRDPNFAFVPPRNLVRTAAALVAAILLLGTFYTTYALRQERLVLLARLAFLDEDWRSTVAYARRATTSWKSLDPFATPVVFLEGMGHLMLADHRRALGCFQQARNKMPSRAYIINSLGLTHSFLREYPQAINCYLEVLARSPENAGVIKSLASASLGAGRPDEARAWLGRLRPEDWDDAVQAIARRLDRDSGVQP